MDHCDQIENTDNNVGLEENESLEQRVFGEKC